MRCPPPPGREREQQNRAIADGERRSRRPLEFECRGEPLRGDSGAPMIAADVGAPGALEEVAHDPVLSRRSQSRFPVKEPDRRRPRVERLGRRAAVTQVAQKGRNERRVCPQRLEPQSLGVRGELTPAGLVAAAGVFGGCPIDEFAGGGDGAGDGWGG